MLLEEEEKSKWIYTTHWLTCKQAEVLATAGANTIHLPDVK